jgi:hypothetical protein
VLTEKSREVARRREAKLERHFRQARIPLHEAAHDLFDTHRAPKDLRRRIELLPEQRKEMPA